MKKYLKKTFGVLAVLLCVVALSGVSDVFAASTTYKVNETVKFHQTEARSMLKDVNAFRTKGNAWCWNSDNTTKTTNIKRDALQYDYGLEEIAKQRAAELALYFEHQRPNGKDCWDAKASDGSESNAENIASGSSSAETIFNLWKEDNENYSSQGHRRNMLGVNEYGIPFTTIGIACAEVNGHYYWVQEMKQGATSITTDPGADNSTRNVTIDVAADRVKSTSLNYTGKNYNLSVGGSATLPTIKQNVVLSSGKTLNSNVTTKWNVSDSSIAKVSGNKLTGVKKGTTTLTAMVTDSNGKTQTVTSKVNVAPDGIEINSTHFPDAAFRNYVSKNIDKDHDGYLQKSEINAMTEIGVGYSGIKDLTGIQYFTKLKILNCECNELKILDISKNTQLNQVGCYSNHLKELIANNNPALTFLAAGDNQLKKLDVSNDTNLKILSCEDNQLTSLKTGNSLRALTCDNNQLTQLDISNYKKLYYVSCAKNKLMSLNLSGDDTLEPDATDEGSSKVYYGVSLISPQTRTVEAKVQNGKYVVNLKSFDSTLDSSKVNVTNAAGGTWNAKAGTLTFNTNPNGKKVTYTYNTGYPNSTKYPEYKNLDVTLTIQAKAHTHTFGAWKTTKQATKQAKGIKSRKCTTCGYTETQSINFTYTMQLRIYGATRYETAFKTADTLKAKMGGGQFNAAVVAYGENYPDALSGTYLANTKNAPLLLANKNDKNTENKTIDYISKNVKKGSTVYTLGGRSVISNNLINNLRQRGYNVKQLAGNDRYATNIKILAEAGVKSGQDLLVCTGNNYPDALSTSALGKPILLVGNQVTAQQRSMIQRTKFKNIYIIGGTAAINPATMNSIRSINSRVSRINGIDRYETSAKIAKQFCKSPTTVVLAYGQNFPDGLAGGTLAYKAKAPLLLADSNPTANRSIAGYVDSTAINNMYVLGGPGLISNNAAESILRYDK